MNAPRVVVTTRPTPLQQVLQRHGTPGQARFFLAGRGLDLADLEAQEAEQERALALVDRAIPADWRRARVQRADFARFLFEPDDLVVAIGQDGLVANLAKYLAGQPLIGINPSPARFDGILVPHAPEQAAALLQAAAAGKGRYLLRTMVEARLDDGQTLRALNEIFVGHCTHQSARYRIRHRDRRERHSSSGVLVATGTGATGWARSIHTMRQSRLPLPGPADPTLAFFVREAFPSQRTQVGIQEGLVQRAGELELTSEMDEGGVLFGDGIEADRIEFPWGSKLVLGTAATGLRLLLTAG